MENKRKSSYIPTEYRDVKLVEKKTSTTQTMSESKFLSVKQEDSIL